LAKLSWKRPGRFQFPECDWYVDMVRIVSTLTN
jgi:hypothetical protein